MDDVGSCGAGTGGVFDIPGVKPAALPTAVEHLVSMGFPPVEASRALLEAGDNLEAATAALLGSVAPAPSPMPAIPELPANLRELVQMGFPEGPAREALAKNYDNIEHAVLELIGSSGEHPEMERAAEITSPLSPNNNNSHRLADRQARYAAAEERLSNDLLSEEAIELPSAPPLSTAGRRQEAGFVLNNVPRPPVERPAVEPPQKCWACGASLTFAESALYTICNECGTLTTVYGQNGEALCQTLNIACQ